MRIPADGHAARVDALRSAARARADAPWGLSKSTSNLFRAQPDATRARIDLRDFRHVLGVEAGAGWVDAEGLVSYEALADATLAHGLMPAVVPQLKTITLGGAAAGVGIEATSFRHGLVHDTLLEFELLLPGGEIVLCSPDNAFADLFHGFPNSYGTLGYALRLRARTQAVRPYVRVEHLACDRPEEFFAQIARQCAGDADFVDAVVFGPREMVVNAGRFVDEAPQTSDYSFEHIYFRSLLEKPVDHLRTRDYLWRWDTDWFWCSKNFGAQNPLLRRLIGRGRLNSRTYTRWMRLNERWGLTRAWARLGGWHPESVIQDVDIPLAQAQDFLHVLLREIGILPIWVCPIRTPDPRHAFTLYPLSPQTQYLNFGFWDVVKSRRAWPPGHFNRLVERQVIALGGIKSLYSDSYFTREEFSAAYAMERYETLKRKYDPQRRAPGLYEKCVLAGRA
jgi:FAD/FMN-containing dehydrogenase